MESTKMKDPEASPLLEVDIQTNKSNDASGESSSKDFGQELAQKVCCTFRVRVFAIILLLLFQIPIFAYYYRTSYNLEFGDLSTHLNPELLWDNYVATTFEATNRSHVPTRTVLNTPSLKSLPVTESTKEESKVEIGSPVIDSNDDEGLVKASTTKLFDKTIVTYSIDDDKDIRSDKHVDAVEEDTMDKSTTTVSTTTTITTTIMPATTTLSESTLPVCPETPPKLEGHLAISFDKPPNTFEKTLSENPFLTDGGHGKPSQCLARHKVAIIIPYRDRMEHLKYFVEFMHPVLSRQEVDYQIFIINQFEHGKFNRAKLMNVGFIEAQKIYPFDCFAFHDVDLILEDDRSLYWCSDRPRHMSAGVDKFNYVLPYGSIFGGVTLLSKKQMEDINGFSNEFWGWGGEDDDVFNRLRLKKYSIVRYPMEIARYKMIRHSREKGNTPNPKRFELIRKTHQTYMKDGINSIKYKVISTEFHPTYTNITVDLFGPP